MNTELENQELLQKLEEAQKEIDICNEKMLKLANLNSVST